MDESGRRGSKERDGRGGKKERRSGGDLSNFAFAFEEGSDVPGRSKRERRDLEWLFKAEQACN